MPENGKGRRMASAYRKRYVLAISVTFCYLYMVFVAVVRGSVISLSLSAFSRRVRRRDATHGNDVAYAQHVTGLYEDAQDALTVDDQNRAWRTFCVHTVSMHVLFAMFVISYGLACTVSPMSPMDMLNARKSEERRTGTLSKYSNLWYKADQYSLFSVERKGNSGKNRYCKQCHIYKPDRTHHDRQLGQCVLKMDHYCPWLDNTLGFNNAKYFFLAVFYGNTSLFLWLGFMSKRFWQSFAGLEYMRHDFFVLFAYFTAGLLVVPVTWFFWFHCRLMSNARTTIEYCERMKSNKDSARFYEDSPFDCGWFYNCVDMLGPNPLLWIFPTYIGMRRDGDLYFIADNPKRSFVDMNHELVKRQMKLLKGSAAKATLRELEDRCSVASSGRGGPPSS